MFAITGKIIKVRPYLDDLVQSGYRISKKLYDSTLERAGEDTKGQAICFMEKQSTCPFECRWMCECQKVSYQTVLSRFLRNVMCRSGESGSESAYPIARIFTGS
ncbi:DUF3368 domain-containing protein [Desulfosporosinus sp. BICA1-9]|uniref:DUF3368 domain-containing protein n=1 Tax=Desulfosporosinus sp. BICA1-9 TaxID=1531958 RepID=UPI000E81FE7A|nr:hypothetical protein [Desulfosporosinus sp.]